jgi:transposase
MANKPTKAKYVVRLEADERQQLLDLISTGRRPAAVLTRARILLKADGREGELEWADAAIAKAVETSESTVHRVRQAFVEESLDAALYRKKPTGRQYRKLDGRRLYELAHQSPRNFGKKRCTWTLRLLADTCLEIGIANSKVSPETVRQALKRIGVAWRRADLWITSPDAHYAQKKARRDRYIRLAGKHREWVVGFVDEVWWSRLARPLLRAWSAGDPLKMHVLTRPDSDPDPVAICCYGLLRLDTDKVILRFVEGRPVGDVTAQFLNWVCEQLGPEGKSRLIVIWDDPSWHKALLTHFDRISQPKPSSLTGTQVRTLSKGIMADIGRKNRLFVLVNR